MASLLGRSDRLPQQINIDVETAQACHDAPVSSNSRKHRRLCLAARKDLSLRAPGPLNSSVPLQQIDPGTMALVVAGYETQYPDPLRMNVGDELKIVKNRDDEWPGWVFCESQNGKRGWVPENAIKIDGDGAVAQQGYEA